MSDGRPCGTCKRFGIHTACHPVLCACPEWLLLIFAPWGACDKALMWVVAVGAVLLVFVVVCYLAVVLVPAPAATGALGRPAGRPDALLQRPVLPGAESSDLGRW